MSRWLPAGTGLVLAAVVAVSLTLRSPIAAVSPVLGELRTDLGLGPGAAGLLTSLPVLCFALASAAVLGLYRRVGAERAVVLSLVVLAAGTLLRSAPGSSPVPALLGTVVIGLAITVGNVVVPVVAKRDFGDRSPAVVGIYTAALTAGAAIAAAGTAPVADRVGWRVGLLVWVALVAVALVLWLLVQRRHRRDGAPPAPTTGPPLALRRNRTAWALTVLFGTQSALYYSMTAWLPSLLASEPVRGRDLPRPRARRRRAVGHAGLRHHRQPAGPGAGRVGRAARSRPARARPRRRGGVGGAAGRAAAGAAAGGRSGRWSSGSARAPASAWRSP